MPHPWRVRSVLTQEPDGNKHPTAIEATSANQRSGGDAAPQDADDRAAPAGLNKEDAMNEPLAASIVRGADCRVFATSALPTHPSAPG